MATTRRRLAIAVVTVCVAQAFRPAVSAQSPTFGVGHPPKADALKQIDIDVRPDGTGLLPGSGTAAKGKDVYTRRCETCHGPSGTEGPQEVLAGGKGSLATSRPQKTVGSAAYVLFLNGIVGEQDVVDQATLPKIQMPNRNGFVADPRPDVPKRK